MRDQPPCRLDARNTAGRRRNAPRPGAVRRQVQRAEPHGGGHAGAARRPAATVRQIPRVAGDPVGGAVGDHLVPELRRCGLGKGNGPLAAQTRDGFDIGGGHQPLVRKRPAFRRQPFDVQQILGGDRNALKRAGRLPARQCRIAGLGVGHRGLGVHVGDAVGVLVQPFDPVQHGTHQPRRLDLAGLRQRQKLGCRHPAQVVIGHLRSPFGPVRRIRAVPTGERNG